MTTSHAFVAHGGNGPPPAHRLSLRAKGWGALLAILGLVGLLAAFALAYRLAVEDDLAALDEARALQTHAVDLSQRSAQIALVVGRLTQATTPDAAAHPASLQADLRALRERLAAATLGHPAVEPELARLEAAATRYRAAPDTTTLAALREELDAFDARLAAELATASSAAARGMADLRAHANAATVTLACTAALGMALIAAVFMLFFRRLSLDIDTLRRRAVEIVRASRGSPAALPRRDELGDLAAAIDQLTGALAQRERELEIERRNVVHQERLAAIGSMAAGVLREIGNPIAAIDGIARAMTDAREGGRGPFSGDDALCDPRAILRESARLTQITRDIAELAATPASRRDLINVNELVSHTLTLLRYEPRLAQRPIETSLDPRLPAIPGVADRVVQLLMNLLINAADATQHLPPRDARVTVATMLHDDGSIGLQVSDNGQGMTEAVRARAFEPLFTTKPAGHGTGIGLPLAKTIVEEHGGTIELRSVPGQGTVVSMRIPATQDADMVRA
jgi:two-component system, NtrC family, sensor kinase